jgi:hypothetical protein
MGIIVFAVCTPFQRKGTSASQQNKKDAMEKDQRKPNKIHFIFQQPETPSPKNLPPLVAKILRSDYNNQTL